MKQAQVELMYFGTNHFPAEPLLWNRRKLLAVLVSE
jgi:hypothetical protein